MYFILGPETKSFLLPLLLPSRIKRIMKTL